MKCLLSTILMVFSALVPVAQEDLKVIKQVGPVYPPAARAVRAFGEVGLEVKIAKDGRVTEAKAYGGHLLLRGASETAAKQWVFSPTHIEGDFRTTLLSFNFLIGGEVRFIPESEKSEEQVTTHLFPHAFAAEIRYETLIPRLQLLPRENGGIKLAKCPLHRSEMSWEIQNRRCDSSNTNNSFERSEQYNAAEDEFFPESNVEEMQGCNDIGIERAETRYCTACRTARSNWLANNK